MKKKPKQTPFDSERAFLFAVLRKKLLTLGRVEEKMTFERGKPTPAFYVGNRQLCHSHLEETRFGVTFSLSAQKDFPNVLTDEKIGPGLKRKIKSSKSLRGTHWVWIEIKAEKDIEKILPVLRLKHARLRPG